MKLLEHMRLLPGRALIRRGGPSYWWGEVLSAPGTRLAGTLVSFDAAEETFQKGKSHYVVALLRKMRRQTPRISTTPS